MSSVPQQARTSAWLRSIAPLAFAACGVVRAPATTATPPLRLLAADPRTDAVAAANTYSALFPLAATASAALAGEGVAGRCLDLAASGTAGALWLLVHHELGHYRVADRLGGDPHIDFDDWITYYRFPPGVVLSTADELELSAAGVNQSTLAAETMYRDWARGGACSSHQALGLFFAAIDLTRYAAKTVLQGPAEFDDIATYVETYGDELSEHEVLWTTAVANLASAPLWCAVAGQYRFAADGERTVAMPTITVGDLVCAAPWFSARLARSGPIVSMTTVLGTNHVLPVRVELDVGTHEPVGSLGAALLGLSLGELQLSPFARGSLDTDDELGIAAGIEAAMQLGGGCGAGLELSWRHDDLRSEFDGCFDGVAFRIWVEFAL